MVKYIRYNLEDGIFTALNMFLDFITNPVFITSASAFIISQIIKAIIDAKAHRQVRALGHGGMPSSHSATVCSLALIVGLYSGFGSAAFGISVMLAFIVMSDAAGVRHETAKHSEAIKKLADKVNGMDVEETDDVKTDKLAEFIGHTPLQVVFGAALGTVVAVSAFFIMKLGFGVEFYY